MVFQERFKVLYKTSGCKSLTQFAKKLGINRQSVELYYNSERCPDARRLSQICEKMNISADWLLGLSDSRILSTDKKSICVTTGLSIGEIQAIADVANGATILFDSDDIIVINTKAFQKGQIKFTQKEGA